MANFVHLHTHSEFSLLDGLGKLDHLIERAKSLGMDALALTDHGAMYGSFNCGILIPWLLKIPVKFYLQKNGSLH